MSLPTPVLCCGTAHHTTTSRLHYSSLLQGVCKASLDLETPLPTLPAPPQGCAYTHAHPSQPLGWHPSSCQGGSLKAERKATDPSLSTPPCPFERRGRRDSQAGPIHRSPGRSKAVSKGLVPTHRFHKQCRPIFYAPRCIPRVSPKGAAVPIKSGAPSLPCPPPKKKNPQTPHLHRYTPHRAKITFPAFPNSTSRQTYF